MGNAISSANESTLPRRQQQQQCYENCNGKRCWFEQSGTSTISRSNRQSQHQQQQQQQQQNPESSRMLFLLYLIHRTWNVVVETVDQKGRKWVLATISFTSVLLELIRLVLIIYIENLNKKKNVLKFIAFNKRKLAKVIHRSSEPWTNMPITK